MNKNIPYNRIPKILLAVLLLLGILALGSCRSQQRFGQRKAPRNCNTCTKWSK